MKIPEIRINFSYLLFFGESQAMAGKQPLETIVYYQRRTEDYRVEWRKHESKILVALQSALGIVFYRQVIDVSCAPFFVPKSDPLIMNFAEEPDRFVDVLAHELCHVLLTDNNVTTDRNGQPSMDLLKIWTQLFGERELSELAHIPVHAMSQYIYLDVLGEPSRLERDKRAVENFDNPAPYRNSWRYVEANKYKEIIASLRKSYGAAT